MKFVENRVGNVRGLLKLFTDYGEQYIVFGKTKEISIGSLTITLKNSVSKELSNRQTWMLMMTWSLQLAVVPKILSNQMAINRETSFMSTKNSNCRVDFQASTADTNAIVPEDNRFFV